MNDQLKKLEHKFQNYFENDSASIELLKQAEGELKIKFPYDFHYIAKFYSGGLIGLHSLFSFVRQGNEYNIVDKTLFYRRSNFGLPNKYLALEETESSFIVMETKTTSEEKTPIIYCSIPDAYNLAAEKKLEYKHRIFPSFADFFEYLLTEEEKERGLIPDNT
ncbi:MAG: SMI1/KNR4 family protein [Candidatus Paracaedimonas acanthamoebae]|mgnify:CR=1 FL=1|uniref:SMI1/KNR4 family protein n=1 Tax=Candidatus Paracaedimonas acanthamoebae TaxID=244581 RepID=A0A8J7TTS4_9PROT|nr:SMI1/KNR4 family protein [Candidatus Paracaedimonas acanthamoebae]